MVRVTSASLPISAGTSAVTKPILDLSFEFSTFEVPLMTSSLYSLEEPGEAYIIISEIFTSSCSTLSKAFDSLLSVVELTELPVCIPLSLS